MSGDLLLTKKQVDETVRNKVKLEEDLQRSNIDLIPPPPPSAHTQHFIVITQAKVAAPRLVRFAEDTMSSAPDNLLELSRCE